MKFCVFCVFLDLPEKVIVILENILIQIWKNFDGFQLSSTYRAVHIKVN
jgi:hypothetical protein